LRRTRCEEITTKVPGRAGHEDKRGWASTTRDLLIHGLLIKIIAKTKRIIRRPNEDEQKEKVMNLNVAQTKGLSVAVSLHPSARTLLSWEARMKQGR
jgi:hypothetical protein